jgi:NhaP-type Na+/H+ or K+/H+ antiporter
VDLGSSALRDDAMDPRILLLTLFGLGLLAAVALERWLERLPLSLPLVYVAVGWAAFALPLGLPRLDPAGDAAHALAAEYLTEFIVIVSLIGVGIAIDRSFSWRGWRQVWPLLGVTMPLTIAAVGLLGWAWLGLAPAAAVLLAAALCPTDPVLARSVQVGPPGENTRDDVRFDLTVEAGLNDGLAFPFTYLAIAAVGQSALGGWTLEWFGTDVLWRIGVGTLVGYGVGRAGAWFVFERSYETEDDMHAPEETHATNEGLVMIGSLLAAYGLAEVVGGYGFLAVFVGGVTARQFERQSDYHEVSHHFIDQVERVVLVAMLLGFGGLLASGIMDALTWQAAAVGLLVVLVLRPLAGRAGTIGHDLPRAGKWAVAFLGVRGMGTLYYLSYGLNKADFGSADVLWATASFTILVSIVIHGVTAGHIMRYLERTGANVVPGKGPTKL